MSNHSEAPEGAVEVSIGNWTAVGAYVVGKVLSVEPLPNSKVSVVNVEYPDGTTGRLVCPTTLRNAITDNKLVGAWVKALYTGSVKTQGGQMARLFRVWKLASKPAEGGFHTPLGAGDNDADDLPF